MTDFNSLYEKFQFKENEAEKLRNLHLFAKGFQEKEPSFTIKTIVADYEGENILNGEVKNGKLV